MYTNNYVIVAIFVGLGIFLPVAALTIGKWLRPSKPIDPKLTTPLAVPEGPLSMCPVVAAQRRGVIETLDARLLEISKVQSTAVPAGK